MVPTAPVIADTNVVPTKNRVKNPKGDEYQTPEWVWKPWHQVLHFVIDAAASQRNRLPPTKRFYSKTDDAFLHNWAEEAKELGGGAIWCNPPYSRAGGPIARWVEKGLAEARAGAVVCMLLPADPSTNWFSLLWDRLRCCWKDGVHGVFVEGRVRFIHPKTGKPTPQSPNFGSLIVVLSKPAEGVILPREEGVYARTCRGMDPADLE